MAECPSCGNSNPGGNRFCGACGAQLAPAEAEIRKVVTAVFCDLVGSTTLGETHDPEVLHPVLHAYFEEMRTALERHGAHVQKFIGDAVAAVFGLPRSHEDDALRAVRAALEMQERIGELNRDAAITIACRIGVQTGEVLVPGGDQPLIGDAMNTASRLQTAAEPGQVLIGAPTYELVRDAVIAEPVLSLELKGKADPVAAYRVREIPAMATEGRTRHLESPLVGREREQHQLAEALEQAVADESVHLFTLVGHPGIGKTRLVEEFMATAATGAAVVRGRCLPYGDGITFWPVAEIVRDVAGVAESDAADEAREKIAKLLPEGPDRAKIVERVTELLGLGATPNPDETFWAVRKLLEALAADRALVCVIEDLHWSEPRLLDLIDHVTDWSRGSPILLLCDARPEFLEQRPNWAGGKLNATTTLLQPLSTDEVRTLIANLLGGAGLEEAAVARVIEAAEGNPLFVEQLLAMLVDQGVLHLKDGRWTATGEVQLVVVPPTIQALLGARLDGLDPTERRLLEAGAVEGRTFHLGTVAVLCDLPRQEAARVLLGMARKELLRPDRAALEGEEAFRFRHVLIADAAYEAIPKRTRAQLHERFADHLEGRLGDRVPEYQEILGYHFERALRFREELGLPDDAGLAARASAHLVAAGRRALARGDAAAAVLLLEQGMELLPAGRDRFALVPELSWAMGEMGRSDDAWSLLTDTIAATTEADGLLWHRLRVERALANPALDELPTQAEELAIADAAATAAEEAGDDLTLSRALLCRGRMLEDLPPVDIVAARDAIERSCEVARRAGDARMTGDAENSLGGIYCWGPFLIDEAVALCDELLEGRDDPLLWAYGAANGYARSRAFRGEFDEARSLLADAAARFADLGSARGWYNTTWIRAQVEWEAGDRDAALAVLHEAVERAERVAPETLRGLAVDLAFFTAAAGEVDEAEGWLSRVPQGMAADPLIRLGLSGARLRIHLARGRLDDALEEARRILAAERGTGWLDMWADLLECVTDVFEAAESRDEVRSTLDELADAYRRKGNLVALERTESRITRLVDADPSSGVEAVLGYASESTTSQEKGGGRGGS